METEGEKLIETFCEIAYLSLMVLCCVANLHDIVKKRRPAADAIIQIGGTLTFLALTYFGGLYD